jgi:hypothetical protein
MAQNRSTGRWRQGIPLQKINSSIEDLMGNEENEYPIVDASKIMTNMYNELNDILKEMPKEELKK